MKSGKSTYLVMRRSGSVMMFSSGLGGSSGQSEGPYLHILGVVATEMQSAGSDWDAPDKLFLNGNLMVERGLTDLAWKYRTDEVDARDAALRKVRNMHMPNWLPDDENKPGYNPPGIDKWTVIKAGEAINAN